MKQFIVIFFLSACSYGQVNFSTYGAVGDGVADDTAELQAALDAEVSLIADPGATFRISSRIDIDIVSGQIIDWNGATITTNSALNPMMEVDKRSANGGTTTMTDLIMDGNEVAYRGIQVDSRVVFTNVDIFSFRQPVLEVSPAGFYINYYNDGDSYGDWIFDGCDVYDIVGTSNSNLTDAWGAANGYLIYWREVPTSTTKITIKNASVHDCWGEDAQTMAVFSVNINMSGSLGSLEINNMDLYDWERRNLKIFSGNTTVIGGTISDPSPSNPNIQEGTKSGLVAFGTGSQATGGDNIIFEGVTFIGLGYDGRVIPTNTSNSAFRNCIFTGASVAFTVDMGDFDICNSEFGVSSIFGASIYSYNEGTDYGQIQIDTNNTYTEGSPIDITGYSYVETALECSIDTGVYYVADDGNSGNTGLTEGSPWDLAYAITQVVAGDIVYVKKGVYNRSAALSISQDGTLESPIQFIGYDTTINDIESVTLSSINFGMTTSDTNMPVITRSGGTEDTDAFYINGDYIQLKNIVVTGFNFGFVGNGNNGLLDNIGFFELGPQTGDVYKGFGVRIIGNDWVVKNSYGQNVSAEAFLVRGNNNLISYNEYHSDVVGAQTDYYMTVRATTTENGAFNVYEGNRIYRWHDGSHAGHGYDIKSGNNNIYRDNYAYRTKIEMTFSDTFDNQYLRNFVEGSTARIHITNGAHDNLIDGNIVLGTYQGILGEMYDDGAASPPTDCDCVGDNNVFINNIIAGTDKAVQIQETIGNIVGSTPVIGWILKNNVFYSNGIGGIRTNIDIEDWVLENNIWMDQTASAAINYLNSSSGTNVTSNKENYYNNSFATPSGGGFTNITAHDPLFTNAATNDFTLQQGSLLIDLGATTIYTTDIVGTTRPQGSAFDIGAYEFIPTIGVTIRSGARIGIGSGFGKITVGDN
jgi:hypothetical protein